MTGKSLPEALRSAQAIPLERDLISGCLDPEEELDEKTSRKLNADVFIDDRALGGFVGWSEAWQTLHPEGGEFAHQLKNPEAHNNFRKNENSFLKKLFGSK